MNDEEWDKNENKNVADSADTNILVKWGVITKCYRGEKFQKCNTTTQKLSTIEHIYHIQLKEAKYYLLYYHCLISSFSFSFLLPLHCLLTYSHLKA